MKIALFSESFTPYISGVSRSVEILYKELKNLGHEVYVFSSHFPGHKDLDDNIIRFPSIPSTYPKFRIAIPYSRLIPNINFDIIHSHSPFQLGLISLKLARKKGIPFVYSFHTLFTEYLHYAPFPKFISKPVLSKYLRTFCNRCSTIIAPSEKTKEYIDGIRVGPLVEIIPSGIDMNAVENVREVNLRNKFKLPQDAKILLYVGRLSKEKNVPFIFKSLKLVCKKYPNAYLIIAAAGPKEKEFKNLAQKLGISKNIIFAGQIPYPEIFGYYKSADIFVFASKTETQGLVIAEAKACGLPAVAVNAAGISEGIINNVDGFLTPEDQLAFSEKISLLLDNEILRKDLAEKARENALKSYSSKTVAKIIESVYNALIKKNPNVK